MVSSLPWQFSVIVHSFSQGIQWSFPTNEIHLIFFSFSEHLVRLSSCPYVGICSDQPAKVRICIIFQIPLDNSISIISNALAKHFRKAQPFEELTKVRKTFINFVIMSLSLSGHHLCIYPSGSENWPYHVTNGYLKFFLAPIFLL